MSTYYYAAYFQTPLHQSPAPLPSHHPLGIPSNASNLLMSPAKAIRADGPISPANIQSSNPIEQDYSPFFRLPAELRNQIYTELLCPDTPTIKALAQESHHVSSTLHPSILSTCRKIHAEATDLLYTTHTFHAHPSLLTSLPHLSSAAKPVLYPTMLAKIKRWQLTLRLDTDPRFTAEQAATAFSGAEFLEIRVWQSMFDGTDCSVLKLFLGVRSVKVARVRGSVERELAGWLEGRMMAGEEERCECTCGKADCVRDRSDVGEKFSGKRNEWQFGNR
jgi:hypothetical protein